MTYDNNFNKDNFRKDNGDNANKFRPNNRNRVLVKVDPKKLIKMHTMMKKLGLMDSKRDLMDTYAVKGRYIVSSKNMYDKEASAIIKYLTSLQKEGETPDMEKIKSDILCRKIFSCFSAMNWKLDGKMDMDRIYTWIFNNGYLSKHFKKYSLEELPKLMEQVEAMRDEHFDAMKKKYPSQ